MQQQRKLPAKLKFRQATTDTTLVPFDERIEKYIKEAKLHGFVSMFRDGLPKLDHELLSAFVDRWCENNQTFFLRGGRVMPTLKDMSTYTTLAVNGLPVCGNNLVSTMDFPSLLGF